MTMNEREKKIAIYTLTSELHDEGAVTAVTHEFLNSLQIEYDLRGNDYAGYGSHTLDLIYVRTGGTEGIFLRLLPQLQAQSTKPFYLLTSGKSNSLAASMEILSYLRQQGFKGEIIHGNSEHIRNRINNLSRVAEARELLQGTRLGIVGHPSDWLISSRADKDRVCQQLGIRLVDIPMQELLDTMAVTPVKDEVTEQAPTDAIRQSLPVANQIYDALKALIEHHRLSGFTLRCFDLLSAVHNTGCLALARLNAENTVAGCEGDVPALLTMTIVKALTGISGFQANPSSIDPETGTITLAHCTIPLNMVEHYELDTHFESGIGIGIRGHMTTGPVTIFKVSGDLQRSFVAEGELVRNESKPDLCRTQLVVRLSNPADTAYFLTYPIGNHHIVVPGRYKSLFEDFINDHHTSER